MFHYLGRKTSNEVLHDVEKQIVHSKTANLLCFFTFCRLLRFHQHYLLARGFLLQAMTVLDDEKILDFSFLTEIRILLLRILLGFEIF